MNPDWTFPEGWLRCSEMESRLGVNYAQWKHWMKLVLVEDRDWCVDQHAVSRQWTQRVLFRPEVEAVLASLLRGDIAISDAREILAGRQPVPEPIPVPRLPPEVEEELEVVSRPRTWPGGQVSHFPNPYVIQARRSNGELVSVRVASSRCFTPLALSGEPMKLRAHYGGDPRGWALLGPLPRGIGRW